VYTEPLAELSSRGLSAPLFPPFSRSFHPSCHAPDSFVILSAVRLSSRSCVTDSTPGICGLPALTFLSCYTLIVHSAPCRFRRLGIGPQGPSENSQGSDEPPLRLTVTSDIRHLAVPHTYTHTYTAEIFKTFPTEKHFEVRTDTEHLDKPVRKTLSLSLSLSLSLWRRTKVALIDVISQEEQMER